MRSVTCPLAFTVLRSVESKSPRRPPPTLKAKSTNASNWLCVSLTSSILTTSATAVATSFLSRPRASPEKLSRPFLSARAAGRILELRIRILAAIFPAREPRRRRQIEIERQHRVFERDHSARSAAKPARGHGNQQKLIASRETARSRSPGSHPPRLRLDSALRLPRRARGTPIQK